MKKAMRIILTIILGVAFTSAPSADGEDWPQWRGAEGNGQVAGFSEPDQWPKTLTRVWTAIVGEGDASPAFVDGKLYIFSRQNDMEILRCLDAESGDELWKTEYESVEIKGAARGHPGPRSSPAVAKGKIITIGVAGVVSCFNAEDGELLWQKDEFSGEYLAYYASASPLIVDDICVVQLGGKKSGAIIAFDLTDGTEVWRSTDDPPAYASPALMTVDNQKLIVALTAQNLVGISVDEGLLLWQTPFAPGRMGTNSATPVIHGDVVIISGQKRGTTAIRIKKSDGQFAATELWKNTDVSTAFNTPVLIENMLVGLSDRKQLYGLDFTTGETLWIDDKRSESFGAIVNAGSTLFILPSDGELAIGKADRSQYENVASYTVSQTATYAYPIISGNRIYIQDQQSITAWRVQ